MAAVTAAFARSAAEIAHAGLPAKVATRALAPARPRGGHGAWARRGGEQPAAEVTQAGGAEVIAAIVAGHEMTNRLAVALPAGDHHDRGYHPSTTCGAFGAAAARVLGPDAARIEDAFGIALSQAAGRLQFLQNGAWTKALAGGLGRHGRAFGRAAGPRGLPRRRRGPRGKAGFLRAHAPNPIPERALRNLGHEVEPMETAVKPDPSCRCGHADAALLLRAEHNLEPEGIESVTLGLPDKGLLLVGAPLACKRHPKNTVDGRFSGPFVVACALAHGEFGWDSYARMDEPVPRARDRVFTRMVVVPKGEPGNFLTGAELRAKSHGLADPVPGAGRATRLADAVLGLERAADVRAMMRLGAPLLPARMAGE